MSTWSSLFGKDRPTTGISLSGGAVYGAAHVGVLKAIEEKGIEINAIAGTSIGAFIGALYAFGMTSDEIRLAILDVDWLDISSVSLSQYGLLSNRKMGKFLEKHIGKARFEDARMKFDVVATDISNGEIVVLNSGSVIEAVVASASIPGIFKPVELDGRLLADGGIVENLPITPLLKRGVDRIIAVDLNSRQQTKKPENIIELLLNAFHFTLLNASRIGASDADLLIQPDLSRFNRFDTRQTKGLLEAGYAEAKKVLES